VILEGDITLESLGLDNEILSELRNTVSICIHAASSLNLKANLRKTAESVVKPSMAFAALALGFRQLKRFVFVSTAYTNAFMHFLPVSDGKRQDCFVEEKIYPLPSGHSQRDPFLELEEIERTGDTPEYSGVPHPFAYAYGKHLAERLLLNMFGKEGKQQLLTIIRPSCFGPAESEPFPHFETPGSSPATSVLCIALASLPKKALFTSNLADPSKATLDEVPVDVVVNRLIAHVAYDTQGCVHAVSGESGRRPVQKMIHAALSLRKWWWPAPNIVWCSESTDPKKVCAMSKIFRLCGCSFLFSDAKTAELWNQMDDHDREKWNLWTRRDPEDFSDIAIRSQTAGVVLQEWLLKRHKISPRITRILIPERKSAAKIKADNVGPESQKILRPQVEYGKRLDGTVVYVEAIRGIQS
jgi:hypothetical protein